MSFLFKQHILDYNFYCILRKLEEKLIRETEGRGGISLSIFFYMS